MPSAHASPGRGFRAEKSQSLSKPKALGPEVRNQGLRVEGSANG